MFREKPKCLDVVSIDLKAIFDIVSAVFHKATNIMVSPPEPGVINDNILVIDFKHTLCGDF